MKLIVGLGNPGKKYKNNRHNVGYLLLERYSKKADLSFKKRIKYDFIKNSDAVFIKPKTYMNRSGNAVTSVFSKYKFDDILVVVDDVNLPLGEIRLRKEGGFGGHNGLRSIAEALGYDEFKRLRIGVSIPENKNLSDYVLSDFSQDELQILEIVLDFSEALLNEYLKKDFSGMLNYYSKSKESYSEQISKAQNQ